MKKYIAPLLFFAILPCCMFAQTKQKSQTKKTQAPSALCDFEKLFSVKPGMDMPSAIAQLQQNSKITLVDETTSKLKPYNAGEDSILQHTVTYRIDSNKCMHGEDNTIKFEFADGKLYKAYIESIYPASKFAEMMANFDFLHKQILQFWKIEKSSSMKSENFEGFGYNFYKTLDKKVKLDMCMLQYVKSKGNSPGNDKYHLEVLWVNLNNTRMENSMY